MVAQSNIIQDDNTWYADSGANQHNTADIDNLHLAEPYTGEDKVVVGNGNGLQIKHTGARMLHTPDSTLKLKNIIHCPKAAVNLLSINRFCIDNGCYFILTGSNFFCEGQPHGTQTANRQE